MMVADPLLCAVSNPLLFTVRTLALSDCQFVQVVVTFCEVPFEKLPVAVVCAVSPTLFKTLRFTDRLTDWSVGPAGVGVGVVGVVGDEPPHVMKKKPRDVRSRRRMMHAPLPASPPVDVIG
jgi:hypothetical protein